MADPNPTSAPDTPDLDAISGALLSAASRIMAAIATAPDVDLNDPVHLLALQLLGPCLHRALGMDEVSLRASMENTLEISLLIDPEALRALLREKALTKEPM